MTTTLQRQLAQAGVGLLAATLLAASATAQQAYTTRQVNLRAGPDRAYPLVAYVGAGQPVYVNGCVDDYRWCDITAGPHRGWAFARFLEFPYQNSRLSIYDNGSLLAIPIVSFILGSYWNDYYRDRPWYRHYNRWNDWRPGTPPPPGWRPEPRPPRPPVVVQPPPPRPPVVRPQPPRPPVYERPNPGRPPGQPPRESPPSTFPQKQGPGASKPTGSANL